MHILILTGIFYVTERPASFSTDKGTTSSVFDYREGLKHAWIDYFMVDFNWEIPIQLSWR